ncbi:MAG: oligopeptide transporter, OPT family [bacterium]
MNHKGGRHGSPEFTPRAIALGIVLALVMCAANTYLGLYAGMTVSASIPAAVISMGILRGVMRRGSILENNIVQTAASAGESLAAGIIFTVPALVIAGAWGGFHYWHTTLIALTGGVLGVLFMIPLRRPVVVEEKGLVFPEGVACAEVLQAGEEGGARVRYVFASLGAGAVFKFLVSGVTVIMPVVEWGRKFGRAVFYFGADVSPALLGVGYIVGFNVAALVFIGGCIGWVIAIPASAAFSGAPTADPLDFAWSAWSSRVRYMGVGAMAVGGAWSVMTVRGGIARGLREAVAGFAPVPRAARDPGEGDIPGKFVLPLLAAALTAVFFVYRDALNGAGAAMTATVSATVCAFFFVAVSSYIVGLVGSSNNPVSGMTICAVLLTGGALLLAGITGAGGVLAALCVAGVVCCAACTSGDISQDLKTGRLVGASPRRQQWAQLAGVAVSAFIIAPILVVLHETYGIGTGAAGALKAPQATLFAGIAGALFGEGALPYDMVLAGAAAGVGVIVLDYFLKRTGARFRAHVMPVAVGIYLPLSLSAPVFLGGIIALVSRGGKNAGRGVLISSGLIAGEAVTGILVGAVMYFKKGLLPATVAVHPAFTAAAAAAVLIALAAISRGKGTETPPGKP